MLIVKTTIQPSTIQGAGLGLFAEQDIAIGTPVWVFNRWFDISYPCDSIFKMNAAELEFFYKYAYLSKYSGNYILSVDNSHFCNDSRDANNLGVRAGDKEHVEFALRDIKKGEELLINYTQFDLNEH